MGLAKAAQILSAFELARRHLLKDPQPSAADLRLQARLTEAANILGLRVLDHIIVTRKGHHSFQEAGLIS